MADSSSFTLKRLREDSFTQQQEEESHRHNKCLSSSYNQIISLLEEDEEEPNQDLSSLITSLQQEIMSASCQPQVATQEPFNRWLEESGNSSTGSDSVQASSSEEEDEDDKQRVIRHLLEASDDELGIPNGAIYSGNDYGFDDINGRGFEISLGDGLWQFEDEAANYYTMLQSEGPFVFRAYKL